MALHLLEDVEPAVLGMGFASALDRLRPARVHLNLGRASLREAMFALPAIDALARTFSGAETIIDAAPEIGALLRVHVAEVQKVDRSGRSRGSGELVVDLTPNRRRQAALRLQRGVHRMAIPGAPFPYRQQHASGHWIDGARVAGLAAGPAAASLRLPAGVRSRARSLARRLAGAGGPLVAVLPTEDRDRAWGDGRWRETLALLRDRIGARGIQLAGSNVEGAVPIPERLPPAVVAALLGLCAVSVGDDGGWLHVAAAVGAPVVSVHGPTCPVAFGPASPVGAALFTTAGRCARCRRADGARRCLPCLDPDRVAGVAERLAAERWPWDRLERLLP